MTEKISKVKQTEKFPVKGYIFKKITTVYGPCMDKMEGTKFEDIKPVEGRPLPNKMDIQHGNIELPTGVLGKYGNSERIADIIATPHYSGEGRLNVNIPFERTNKGYELKVPKDPKLTDDFEEIPISKILKTNASSVMDNDGA